jgi:hypothetical protein
VSFSVLFVYMCTVLLPPGGYPIAVKYISSYQFGLFKVNSVQPVHLFGTNRAIRALTLADRGQGDLPSIKFYPHFKKNVSIICKVTCFKEQFAR